MGLPENFWNDVYNGVKNDFKRSPWLGSSLVSLWVFAYVIAFGVYPKLALTDDVKKDMTQVDQKVDIVLRIALEDRLKNLVRLQCNNPNEYWTLQREIDTQKDDYERLLNPRKWQKMTCEEARR